MLCMRQVVASNMNIFYQSTHIAVLLEKMKLF